MSFAQPQLLWLLLLVPAMAWLARRLWDRRLAAAAAWSSRAMWDRLLASYRPRRIVLSVALLTLAVAGTALALARPRWGDSDEKVERQGVDLVFVLDSSLSMGARDVGPSRLYVAKSLIRRLGQAMPNNRVGLVQAEGTGAVLSPLTTDGAVLDLLLDTVEPGSLPTPGTELASGIETALRLFGEESKKHRALVLLSDGEDHGGRISGTADRLKNEGIAVFAFGIGTPEGAPVPLIASQGSSGGVKQDANGQVVISRLHEESLETLARDTGGFYLRATSAAADPAPIVRRIDRLEKRTLESESVNTREERFQWPLAAAVLALAGYLAAAPFKPAPGEIRR